LITYEVTNGRDILPLALIKGEEEVLLLPGATFTITAVRERSLGGHRAGGKKTYDVTMKQTA
jgi:hypothetical protein